MRLFLHPAHISGHEKHGAVQFSLLLSALRQAAGRCWEEEEGHGAAALSTLGYVVPRDNAQSGSEVNSAAGHFINQLSANLFDQCISEHSEELQEVLLNTPLFLI